MESGGREWGEGGRVESEEWRVGGEWGEGGRVESEEWRVGGELDRWEQMYVGGTYIIILMAK